MPSFHLSDVVLPDSDHLLEAVLRKFDYNTGINVYRSCRGLQEVLDRFGPRWTLPGSTLSFDINKDDNQFIRKIMFASRGQTRQKTLTNDSELMFLRVCAVNYVGHCPSSFIERHLIPTMEALKGVKLFSIGALEKDGLDVLFPSIGPRKLKNIGELEVILRDTAVQSLVSSRSLLFNLCRGQKIVRLLCAFGYSPSRKVELFKALLEGWLAGEVIGSLEKVVIPGGLASTRGPWIMLEEIVAEYEILVESIAQLGVEEYHIKRPPTGRKDQLILKKKGGYRVAFRFI